MLRDELLCALYEEFVNKYHGFKAAAEAVSALSYLTEDEKRALTDMIKNYFWERYEKEK